jgi:Ran GTPase-activating protein (RanGAP) involved in mRNA processing and transport
MLPALKVPNRGKAMPDFIKIMEKDKSDAEGGIGDDDPAPTLGELAPLKFHGQSGELPELMNSGVITGRKGNRRTASRSNRNKAHDIKFRIDRHRKWVDDISLNNAMQKTKKLENLPEYGHLTDEGHEQSEVVDTSHKKFGDNYMLVLVNGLHDNKSVRVLIFKDSRISDLGFISLFGKMAGTRSPIEVIDLSENAIRKKGINKMLAFMESSFALKKISLQKMHLTDGLIKPILNHLPTLNLISLSLAENKIGDLGASLVAMAIEKGSPLTELDLSWNEIQAKGVTAIASALITNTCLESLDLSWNAAGTQIDGRNTRTAAATFARCFTENKSLTHLNLSHNRLTVEDSAAMAEGLKQNHAILGLHMSGNQSRSDAYGYLMPDAEPWPLEAGHFMTRIIGAQVTGRDNWSLRESCWICGFWRETRFTYTLTDDNLEEYFEMAGEDVDVGHGDEKKFNQVLKSLNVHMSTSFDKWQPEKMTLVEEFTAAKSNQSYTNQPVHRPTFEIYRMVPPGSHHFLYSIEGSDFLYDEEQAVEETSELLEAGQIVAPEGKPLPEWVNKVEVKLLSIIEKLEGHKALFTQPRMKAEDAVKIKIWGPEDSIFASEDFVMGDQSCLRRACANDWQYCKSSRLKDTYLSYRLGEIAMSNIELIHNVYVHYSCCYSSETFTLGSGAFNEFVTRCKMMKEAEANPRESKVAGKGQGLRGSMNGGKAGRAITKDLPDAFMNPMPDIPVPISRQNSVGAGSKTSSRRGSFTDAMQSATARGGVPKKARDSGVNAKLNVGWCTRTDVDMIFVANCITGPKHENNGKRFLNRFQFIDSLIALGTCKYVVSNMCEDSSEALEKLIKECVEPFAERDDSNAFFKHVLLTEKVDKIVRQHKDLLERVYKAYSGAENGPNEAKAMSLREFFSLCDTCRLIEDALGDRSVKLIFVRSKAPYLSSLNETNTNNKLTFMEFMQATVRIADGLALVDQQNTSLFKDNSVQSDMTIGDDGSVESIDGKKIKDMKGRRKSSVKSLSAVKPQTQADAQAEGSVAAGAGAGAGTGTGTGAGGALPGEPVDLLDAVVGAYMELMGRFRGIKLKDRRKKN